MLQKKLYCVTSLWIGLAFAGGEQCKPCSLIEAKEMYQRLRGLNYEQQLSTLKEIIKGDNPDSRANFNKIRALFCSLAYYKEMQYKEYGQYGEFPGIKYNDQVPSDSWFDGGYSSLGSKENRFGLEDKVTGRTMFGGRLYNREYLLIYDILKLAIRHIAAKTASLIYAHSAYKGLNVIDRRSLCCLCAEDSPRGIEKKPNDLEILAQSVKNHKDPIGMARTLLRYRPKEEFLSEEDTIPQQCFRENNSVKLKSLCNFLQDMLKKHNGDLKNSANRGLDSFAKE